MTFKRLLTQFRGTFSIRPLIYLVSAQCSLTGLSYSTITLKCVYYKVAIFLKKIKVGKGCRQGDPIAPYLFLKGAEILALLIKLNHDIVGLKLFSHCYKITQFADDTTLILDGSQQSLQAALNTLEIFGNFVGLKINKEKTKVLWIGRKKHSKDKLQISEKLDSGKTDIKLLGITFNVDLNEMPVINLNPILEKILTDIINWQSRQLTPMGKITVLKTMTMSKFIHIFSVLPISESFVHKLHTIFFKFLWNNKPGKLKEKLFVVTI